MGFHSVLGFVENELVGNCNDVYDSISTKPVSSGVYTVYPCGNATCPVSLYCDMTTDGEPWTVNAL